jgi:amino-acid N-acetyltransferase
LVKSAIIKVEKAKISEVPGIHKLVNSFAAQGVMLARPLSEIYENIRDFVVVRKGKRIIGCAALHVLWSDLAEIKSVAVDQEMQHQGMGAQLVQAMIKDAGELGIDTVFCLTYKPEFFKKLGLKEVEKMTLPQKIWTECYRCSKFPNCDETAMTIQLGKKQEVK